jgi:AcrR family transcriptional regulator
MMTGTEVLPDARHRAILEAALAVFLASGIDAASIDEVRRSSGASVGSLYHRFGSKEGIAAAVYLDALADYQREFVATLDRAHDAAGGVRSAVRTHMRWVRQNPDRAQFLFAVAGADVRRAARVELRELNDRFFDYVEAWLRRHVDAGELRSATTDVFYALWLGPSQELARIWLARGRKGMLRNETAVLADAAWRSLRAESDGEESR